jgi:hypothetical protein
LSDHAYTIQDDARRQSPEAHKRTDFFSTQLLGSHRHHVTAVPDSLPNRRALTKASSFPRKGLCLESRRPPAQDKIHQTRWLCSGYAFVAVGNSEDRWFFTNEHSGGLAHFRHHYFALGMIAHFHRASLLRFKHALAEAADALFTGESAEARRIRRFRGSTERLMKELLRYRTLYWFAEVSNQIQGRELFDLFKRHLNLEALFDDVCGDAENAASLLRRWDEDEQGKTTRAITLLGVMFTIVGPAIVLLQEPLKEAPLWNASFTTVLLCGVVLLLVPSVYESMVIRVETVLQFWRRRLFRSVSKRSPARSWFSLRVSRLAIGCCLAGAGVYGLYTGWNYSAKETSTRARESGVPENTITPPAAPSILPDTSDTPDTPGDGVDVDAPAGSPSASAPRVDADVTPTDSPDESVDARIESP